MRAGRYWWAAVFAVLLPAAQAQQVLKLEQPPPGYAYDEARPAHLHFKEVTVERLAKYALRFDFLLQAPLPKHFFQGEGVRYKVYFDLDGMVCDYQERKIPPDFASDLIIAVYQNPGTNSFDSWVGTVRVRSKVHEIKISKLRAKEDHISFDARCQLFGEVEGLRFFVSSGRLVWKDGRKRDGTVQDSKVFEVPYKKSGLDTFLRP